MLAPGSRLLRIGELGGRAREGMRITTQEFYSTPHPTPRELHSVKTHSLTKLEGKLLSGWEIMLILIFFKITDLKRALISLSRSLRTITHRLSRPTVF